MAGTQKNIRNGTVFQKGLNVLSAETVSNAEFITNRAVPMLHGAVPHLTDKDVCSLKYVTDDALKRAFVTMMNKLVFGHQIVLRPLLQSLRGMNDKAQLLKMQELEAQIEKNMEQRQVLTSLMAGGYLEPALFNKESNALAAEAEALRQEKDSLIHSLNGNMVKADELQKLLRFDQREPC